MSTQVVAAETMPRPRLRTRPKRPPLINEEILHWADEWFAAHGRWPNVNSGLIPGTIDDTWARIDDALRQGYRGLPKKRPRLSLARLLEKRRGVRNSEYPPPLSMAQIVRWAKKHHERSGQWPKASSGAIQDAPGETWQAIDMALRKGKRRGLPGGSSLARLLASRCGVRNPQQPPRLTVARILLWADAYYARHDKRPTRDSGPIADAPGETWMAVYRALQSGRRGLPGGSSLAQLLDAKRPHWLGRQKAAAQSRRRCISVRIVYRRDDGQTERRSFKFRGFRLGMSRSFFNSVIERPSASALPRAMLGSLPKDFGIE